MIYRGPGFLAVYDKSFTPTPSPSVSWTVQHTQEDSQLTSGRGGVEGVGVEPNHTIIRPQESLSRLKIIQSSLVAPV
jgi:hypothetical protein